MYYFSLNKEAPKVSFEEAVVRGLAPDKGLYFPEEITPLPKEFFNEIENLSNTEIAYRVIQPFIGDEIPEKELRQIIEETLCFDFPTVKIDENTYALELFHGPTMAFKDVGARFMARCLGYFNKKSGRNAKKIKVLVATSGDTGGAVANGFLGVKNVEVVILYPTGKVSNIQEKQLTTLGQNISALEVQGTFDDCQAMVKKAFLDESLYEENLTSANSINVARWLPQLFYFFFAYKQLKSLNKPFVFSVPSGNFGNSCAGLLAQKLGMPLKHLVASTNINDTVPRYLITGKYVPRASKHTISNAMDVGDPSNFVRIREIFNDDRESLMQQFSSFSFNDAETRSAIKKIYKKTGYIADPHGAVGYLGFQKIKEKYPTCVGVFLETAHPVKFLETVEETIGKKIEIPSQIEAVLDKPKESTKITTYDSLKNFLKH